MKKITAIILSTLFIMGVVIAMPITSNATDVNQILTGTQSKSENFSKAYSISGNGAIDMVNVAKAQNEKTQSALGYTEWWCADFVSDCAKLVGQGSAIPFNGVCNTMYNAVINAGGKVVGNAQAGDLVFFSNGSGYGHVGIAINNSQNISGNINYANRGVIKVCILNNNQEGYSSWTYVRPNYKVKTTPTPVSVPTGSKTVSEGTYHIVSALNESYGLNVAYNSKDSGKNVQLWNNMDEKNLTSLINLKYNTNGIYTLTFRNSGKNLDVQNADTKSGANVWQYNPNNSKAQQWIIKPTGDGYFYIISALSGKYLDVKNGVVTGATNIQVYNGNSSKAQKWRFLATGMLSGQTIRNGNYSIATAINNNYGLNIYGGKTTNGANIHIWNNMKSGNLTNTIVNVKHLGNGIYTLTFKKSNKVLDIYGSHTTSGTNVHQWAYVGKDNQKWIIKSAGNGYYYIIGRGSGLALDVSGGKAVNGTNVQAYLLNKTNAQKWKFFAAPTLNKTSITIKKGKTYKIFVKGQSATAAKYSSTNKTVATVNKSGVVTGKKKGTATIKVAYRGISMSCKVTVK